MLGQTNGTTKALVEAREAVRALEGAAQTEAMALLSDVADRLVEASGRLERSRPAEWMTPEQARSYLGLTTKQWERLSPSLPRRYLSERVVRYPREELDAALAAADDPGNAVVTRIRDENSGQAEANPNGAGGAASLQTALKRRP